MEGTRPPRGARNFRNKKQYGGKQKYYPKKNALANEKELITQLQEKYLEIDAASIAEFSDLPLSPKTLLGLEECDYLTPTEIQRETIALSLTGQDVIGAARTGSGKTLAFLVPIFEKLFCQQWSNADGLGALVITPTRELAYQIFETLRKVGVHHEFSAGLIIGGKDLRFEKKRVDRCNIIICTPGRLLQHMDENPLFDCSNLQLLVLDEADRCLDMGFQNTMNAIIENLPAERQTLLFSATQTKSVQDLARLSLKDPMYVAVHEISTPDALQQSYIVCNLEDKLCTLFSFIKSHLKMKVIVFMSSCNQVKYHHDLFCRLRLGPSILQLQGSLHQLRRMAVYETFCAKSSAVLFATDLAARGLDFPAVDWVIHYDCPEDVNTYIHRSGRTARFKKGGESLLMLLPSEERAMIDELDEKKVPITKIQINVSQMKSPIARVTSLLAQYVELKEAAQRAFVSYVKSVFLMKNKKIFDVQALDTQAYSASLGLVVPPRIRFLQRFNKRESKEKKMNDTGEGANVIEALQSSKKEVGEESSDDDDEDQDEERDNDGEEDSDSNYWDKTKTKQPFQLNGDDSDDESEGELFKLKRADHNIEEESDSEFVSEERKQGKKKVLTKEALAMKIVRKKITVNTQIVFDEEGEAIADPQREKVSKVGIEYDAEESGGIDIEKARLAMVEEDKADKQRFRDLNKAKRREEKLRMKIFTRAEAADDDVQPIDEEVREPDEESEDDDEDEGPDTSWLPDPDVVYTEKGDDSKEFYNSSEEEEEVEVHRPVSLKRKSKDDKEVLVRDKRSREEGQPMDTGLSLMEDEELALKLLLGTV